MNRYDIMRGASSLREGIMKRLSAYFCLLICMSIVLRVAAQVYHADSDFTVPDYNQSLNTQRGYYWDLWQKSVLGANAADTKKENSDVQGAPIYDLLQLNPVLKTHAFYPIRMHDKWGFADERGKVVIAPLLSDFDGRNLLLDPTVKSLHYFKEGTQNVNIDGNSMVLYIHPRALKNDLIVLHPMMIHKKWGYVDNNGHIIIAPRFDRAGIFQGHLAAVLLHHRLYYIHQDGTIAFGGYNVAGTDLERASFIDTPKLNAELQREHAVEAAPLP